MSPRGLSETEDRDLRSYREREELKQNPTPAGWETELWRVIRGKREQALLIDGVAAYLTDLQERSADPEKARTQFDQALAAVTQKWEPAGRPADEIARMLDILGAYRPPGGWDLAMKLLQESPGPFAVQATLGVPDESGGDLHKRALCALARYRLAVEDRGPYRGYVGLLRRHLTEPEYAAYRGYAAGRLLAMEVLDPADAEIADLIEANPEALREIVAVLLAPGRGERRGRDLAHVFKHCYAAGGSADSQFVEALRLRGAVLEGHTLIVRRGEREEIPLRLGKQTLGEYLRALMEAKQTRVQDNLPEFMRRHIEVQKRPAASRKPLYQPVRTVWSRNGVVAVYDLVSGLPDNHDFTARAS